MFCSTFVIQQHCFSFVCSDLNSYAANFIPHAETPPPKKTNQTLKDLTFHPT